MALHRDIYWVGKQWAVTGHGIQACNQKQKGQFDIAGSHLWDDGVQDAVRSLNWVNKEDFDKAVAAARKHYPEPLRNEPSPAPPVSPPTHMAPAPEAEPSRLAPKFDMRLGSVPAKLRPVWRVRPR
ncbi:hypothetical protein [Bradyrhizobium sp.]|uniref:hypothetical protein n=1 Tax=Bradyrhizobium sp. TaxID=376 RepID=UPI00260175CE|nr:hypothetical protein [Bradyrhizobium sp.]